MANWQLIISVDGPIRLNFKVASFETGAPGTGKVYLKGGRGREFLIHPRRQRFEKSDVGLNQIV